MKFKLYLAYLTTKERQQAFLDSKQDVITGYSLLINKKFSSSTWTELWCEETKHFNSICNHLKYKLIYMGRTTDKEYIQMILKEKERFQNAGFRRRLWKRKFLQLTFKKLYSKLFKWYFIHLTYTYHATIICESERTIWTKLGVRMRISETSKKPI